MPIVRKHAKDTLIGVELDVDEILEFTLVNKKVRRLTVLETGAEVIDTTRVELKAKSPGAELRAKGKRHVTNLKFWCRLDIEGEEVELTRYLSSQESFYEPLNIAGMTIWFDAVDDIFDFFLETHGPCRPKKQARFGVQDAAARICPAKLHPWCPLPEGGLRIEDCYTGEDVWMGAYDGNSAHGGLDINHPPGTPLYAPIDIDDHFYFNSLEMGHNNNRWRAIHRWENGSEWILQAHHMTQLTVEEHTPIKAGQQFADGAGVLSGAEDHSHFVFMVHDEGETVMLDPWILFRQMYLDMAE